MNDTKKANDTDETSEETATWQTPGFEVVGTALEVTAYALTDR
ncbi:pyrroloquinoline quinone precursor peptide PqqA [Streptomyces sp. NBC_00306]|nr:pyrroloquinoline quinone precursor peptide PqqA [Streptomyces sp. NBC_00306]